MNVESVAEFLGSIEEFYPLGTHPRFQKEWSDDIREFAKEHGDIDENILEGILSFRQTIASIASIASSHAESKGQDDSWKWLITVHQVEQRTEEWYAETKNILTASEVSAVFKGGRTRGALVMAKASNEPRCIPKPLALRREDMGPMDWGVKYEPIVKSYLEKSLKCKIAELGRIRHRSDSKIAASPDGLIVECESSELVGRLVEIKCPYTRVINDKISFDYWCQMQLQMEVCDRPVCEFVEVKFKEDEVENPGGWIRLQTHTETFVNRYIYDDTKNNEEDAEWLTIENYPWEIVTFKRVSVPRDENWFKQSQETFAEFWKDVEGARAGTWTQPPSRSKNKVTKCEIID